MEKSILKATHTQPKTFSGKEYVQRCSMFRSCSSEVNLLTIYISVRMLTLNNPIEGDNANTSRKPSIQVYIEELRRLGLGHLCTKTYQARVRILSMKGSHYSVIKVLIIIVKE